MSGGIIACCETASAKNQSFGHKCSFGDAIVVLLASSVYICSKQKIVAALGSFKVCVLYQSAQQTFETVELVTRLRALTGTPSVSRPLGSSWVAILSHAGGTSLLSYGLWPAKLRSLSSTAKRTKKLCMTAS